MDLLKNKEKYEEEIDTFIKKTLKINFSKELLNCLNPKLNENLAQEYKKILPLKNAILKCINEFNDIMQSQSINFGLKGLLSTILFGGGLLSTSFGLKKKNATLLTGVEYQLLQVFI